MVCPKKHGENYWQRQITANCRKKVLVNPNFATEKLSQILNFARLGSSQLGIHGLQFLIDAVHGLHLRGFFWKKNCGKIISQGNQEMIGWLVVSTPLKNISQLGLLFPVYGKIKNVPNHQPGDDWGWKPPCYCDSMVTSWDINGYWMDTNRCKWWTCPLLRCTTGGYYGTEVTKLKYVPVGLCMFLKINIFWPAVLRCYYTVYSDLNAHT